MEIIDLLNNGAVKLRKKNISSSKLDAELLLAKVLNKNREDLLINLNKEVKHNIIKDFQKLINRRSLKEPIAYILKKKEFWSTDFYVNSNTLIPRPETELLVEKIIKIFRFKRIFFLDIGTGTGCILLSIVRELKKSKGIGIDISSKAIKIAKINSNNLNLSHRAKFYTMSLDKFFHKKLDLVVSNPPYIMTKDIRNLNEDIRKFEPKLALDGGNDGLDVIKKVIYKSREILKIKGLLALEIGNEQNKEVSKILKKNSFRIKYTVKDYKDNVRCLISSREN